MRFSFDHISYFFMCNFWYENINNQATATEPGPGPVPIPKQKRHWDWDQSSGPEIIGIGTRINHRDQKWLVPVPVPRLSLVLYAIYWLSWHNSIKQHFILTNSVWIIFWVDWYRTNELKDKINLTAGRILEEFKFIINIFSIWKLVNEIDMHFSQCSSLKGCINMMHISLHS